MDDLRWVLAIVGAVIVAAIYFSSRFEREEWNRDREGHSGVVRSPKPVKPESLVKTETRISGESNVSASGNIVEKESKESAVAEAPQPQPSPSSPPTPPWNVAAQKVSVGLNSEADVKSVLDAVEPEIVATEITTTEPGNEWEGAMDSAREPLLEDEIVAVEIPEELSELGEEKKTESKLKFKSEKEEPVQQELVLDVEQLVLILAVMAKNETGFRGSEIKDVLETEGINHGDMDIFHFHINDKKDPVFSVASVVEPGTFALETIDEFTTPGISLFCQLPGPVSSVEAFNILLLEARSIAEKLGGQLCDDKRNKLTDQATAHYFDRIAAFDHEMLLARKKQKKD